MTEFKLAKYIPKRRCDPMIKSEIDSFSKRNIVILGVFAALGVSLGCEDSIEFNMKNIRDMTDEYAMLKNSALRKKKLKSSPLNIKHANFNERFENLVCDNTNFSNCNFESTSLIYVKSLRNVTFTNCSFNDSQISSGLWETVRFKKCTANGKFLISADKGSKDILFEDCEFVGLHNSPDGNDEINFGEISSLGDISVNRCKLAYINIRGELSTTVKDSQLRKISAVTMRENGELYFENVIVSEYIKFTSSIFSKFVLKNSSSELMILDSLESRYVLIEGFKGHIVGAHMTLTEMTVNNSEFVASGQTREPFDNQIAAFSLNGSKIEKLVLDELRFNGTNGTAYLGGSRNPFFDNTDRNSKRFDASVFKNIVITRTILENSFLGNIKSQSLQIRNSEIKNSYFGNSSFGEVDFIDVKLSGNIQFDDTVVGKFHKDKVTVTPSLRLTRDVTKLIDI
jgi:uncharacterized protein YjbI with pentapeptide repeats